jgi:hypothetical protein
MSVNVVPVELPDERDPADYSSADIGDLLAARASAAGVSSAMNI